MENLYNAKLTFKGEGNFTFTLPGYGDLTIYADKDIYVKGLTVNGVEALRQLRPLLLEHKLNAKPDGCYKVIDLAMSKQPIKQFERAYKEPVKSVADMKKELVKGPIVEEEPVVVTPEAIISEEETKALSEKDIIDAEVPEVIVEDESKKEETVQTEPKETKNTKIIKTGKSKIKKNTKSKTKKK